MEARHTTPTERKHRTALHVSRSRWPFLAKTPQPGTTHCVDALLAPGCYIVPTTGVAYDDPTFEDAPCESQRPGQLHVLALPCRLPALFASFSPAVEPTEETSVTRSVIASIGGCHALVLDAADMVRELGDSWMVSKKRRLLTRYTEELLPLFLQRVPFFREIPKKDIASAARRFTVLAYTAGTTIVSEGSRGDAFYVMIHGEYAVTVRGRQVFQDSTGGFFGEIGLLQDVPATASVVARRDSLVMVQHRSAFHAMLEAIPVLRDNIQAHVASRQASSVQKLKSPLFSTMTEGQLNRLTKRIKYTSVGGGTVISDFEDGELVAYVVAQGTVSCATKSGSSEVVELKSSGAAVGVDALLPRASAVSRTEPFKLFTTDTAAVIVKLTRGDIEYAFAGDSLGLSRFEVFAHGTAPPLAALLKLEAGCDAFEQHVGAAIRVKRQLASALADGLGFLPLPQAVAQATGGQLLPSQAGAGDPTFASAKKIQQADKRKYLQKLPVSVSTKIVGEFLQAADEFAGLAFSVSTDGGVITNVPRGLSQQLAVTVAKFCGSAESPGTAIGLLLPPTEVSRLTGLASSSPDTMKLSPFCLDAAVAVVMTVLELPALYARFKASPAFRAVLDDLRAPAKDSQPSGGSPTSKGPQLPSGCTPRIPVEKLNRYGQWQPRAVAVDMDRQQMNVYDDKGAHTHSYPVVDLSRVERVSAEPTALNILFHDKETKDYALKFATAETREQFCLLLHLLEPDLPFSDDAEKYEPVSGRASFAITLDRGSTNRVLIVDRKARTLTRQPAFDDATGAVVHPIEWSRLRLESSLHDPTKLFIVAYDDAGDAAAGSGAGQSASRRTRAFIPPTATMLEEVEVTFATHALRERFSGLIRLVLADVELSAVRVLGLEAAGYVPDRLRICTATLNCSHERALSEAESSQLHTWLPPQECDIYVIGLQECSKLDSWRSVISAALALPGPIAYAPEEYVVVASVTLQEIHTLVFARASITKFLTNVATDTEATGVGGIWGNKGAAAVALTWADNTHIAIVNCHLASGTDKVAVRNSNFSEICQQLKLRSHDYPSMQVPGSRAPPPQFLHNWHHVIWLGNLNYRVDLGKAECEEEYAKVVKYVSGGMLEPVIRGDQLRIARETGAAYSTFSEHPITFAPSYRLEKGGTEYINKRNQNPSYTDRVLWASKPGCADALQCKRYRCDFKFKLCDHRPVVALFELQPEIGFLNLHSASRLRNHGSCKIVIPYLRFDCLPLPPAEFAAGDAGLDVPSWSVKSADAGAAAAAASSGGKGGKRKSLLVATDGLDTLASQVGRETGEFSKSDEFIVSLSSHMLQSAASTGTVKHAAAVAEAAAQGDRTAGLTLQQGSSRRLLKDAPRGDTPGVLAGTNYTVAEWRTGMVPDVSPVISDPGHVASEHILLTVRKKSGALVGHSELSLRDAYHIAVFPDKGYEDVSLHGVLNNPVMRKAFQAFCDRERSRENVDFYLQAGEWLEDMLKTNSRLATDVEAVAAGRLDEMAAQSNVRAEVARIQKGAEALYAEFVDDSAERMVNLPSKYFSRLKKSMAAFRKLSAEDVWAHMFAVVSKKEETAVTVSADGEVDMGDHITSTVSLLAPFMQSSSKDSKGSSTSGSAPLPKMHMRHSGGLLQHVRLFDEAREEIFKLMQKDTLSRFEGTMKSQDRIRRDLGNGAPFCLPVVKDGAVVGSLSGQVLMKVFDVNTERDKRIKDLERVLFKGSRPVSAGTASSGSGTSPLASSEGGRAATPALTPAELVRHIDSIMASTESYETAGAVDGQAARKDIVRLRGVLASARRTAQHHMA